MSISPNINSVLKPPKPRIPLKDIVVEPQDEDSTTVQRRRVSFANVNKIKEFSAVAESMVVCHTPAYEEPFSMSSDSSHPSGIDGCTPGKSNPPETWILQEKNDFKSKSALAPDKNVPIGFTPVEGIFQSSTKLSSDMELTQIAGHAIDTKLSPGVIMDLTKGVCDKSNFPSLNATADDSGVLDMTEAVEAPKISVESLCPNLNIDLSENRISPNQEVDLTNHGGSRKSYLRRQSTRYSMNAMELTEVIDNVEFSGLDLTEGAEKTRLLTNYSIKDMETTNIIRTSCSRLSTNSMEYTEMIDGKLDYSADSEVMDLTKPINNICLPTSVYTGLPTSVYTDGGTTFLSTSMELTKPIYDSKKMVIHDTQGLISRNSTNSSLISTQSSIDNVETDGYSPNVKISDKNVGRFDGTGPATLNLSQKIGNQSFLNVDQSHSFADNIFPSLVNKNNLNMDNRGLKSVESQPKSGSISDQNLSVLKQNEQSDSVGNLNTDTEMRKYDVKECCANDESRAHEEMMVDLPETVSKPSLSNVRFLEYDLNNTCNNKLDSNTKTLENNLNLSGLPIIVESPLVSNGIDVQNKSREMGSLTITETPHSDIKCADDNVIIENKSFGGHTKSCLSFVSQGDENEFVDEQKEVSVMETYLSNESLIKFNNTVIVEPRDDLKVEQNFILGSRIGLQNDIAKDESSKTAEGHIGLTPFCQRKNNDFDDLEHKSSLNQTTHEKIAAQDCSNTAAASPAIIDISSKINNITLTRGTNNNKSVVTNEPNLTTDTSCCSVENTDHIIKLESIPLIERLALRERSTTSSLQRNEKANGSKRSFEEALELENDTEESPVKQICLSSESNVLNNVTAPSFVMDSSNLNETTASDSLPNNKLCVTYKSRSLHDQFHPTLNQPLSNQISPSKEASTVISESSINEGRHDDPMKTINNHVFSLHAKDYSCCRRNNTAVEIRKGVFSLNLIPKWIHLEFCADSNGSVSQIHHKVVCSARNQKIGEYLLRQVQLIMLPHNLDALVDHTSDPVYQLLSNIAKQLSLICHYYCGQLNNDMLSIELVHCKKKTWTFVDINLKYPRSLNATDISISKEIFGEIRTEQVRNIFSDIGKNPNQLINLVKALKFESC